MAGTLTWLGHASFRVDTPGGKRVYIDPFLTGNPKCPESEREPERADVIALTHGHHDHVGDTVALYERLRPKVFAQVELREYLWSKGVGDREGCDLGKGGTADADGLKITLTDARHSSSHEGTYTGEPCGIVLTLEDGFPIYFAGDTSVFGDMQLIARLYRPEMAVLPIGGHYTMGPEEAALALELLGVARCVPCHWGTVPLLAGTPDQLRALAPAGVEVVDIAPGKTIEL